MSSNIKGERGEGDEKGTCFVVVFGFGGVVQKGEADRGSLAFIGEGGNSVADGLANTDTYRGFDVDPGGS